MTLLLDGPYGKGGEKGEAMDFDGFTAVADAAAPPVAAAHGTAAEALLEGAEYDAETEDAARVVEAATAARARPPRPANWETMTRGHREHWKQRGWRPRRNSDRVGVWITRGARQAATAGYSSRLSR